MVKIEAPAAPVEAGVRVACAVLRKHHVATFRKPSSRGKVGFSASTGLEATHVLFKHLQSGGCRVAQPGVAADPRKRASPALLGPRNYALGNTCSTGLRRERWVRFVARGALRGLATLGHDRSTEAFRVVSE